jgi:hypothetical protein
VYVTEVSFHTADRHLGATAGLTFGARHGS